MTQDERAVALAMADTLENEIVGLVKKLDNSREWSLAITNLEQSAMWMRRAIERG